MKTNLKFLNPIKVISQRRSFNKQVFIVALLITCSVATQGQKFYSLSLFNHATTLPPKGFTSVLHPGFDIGISWKQKEKKHSNRYLVLKLKNITWPIGLVRNILWEQNYLHDCKALFKEKVGKLKNMENFDFELS